MLVLFVAFNMVNMAGLNYNSQLLIKGVIIIVSSAGYAYLKRRGWWPLHALDGQAGAAVITCYVSDADPGKALEDQPIQQPIQDQRWRKQQCVSCFCCCHLRYHCGIFNIRAEPDQSCVQDKQMVRTLRNSKVRHIKLGVSAGYLSSSWVVFCLQHIRYGPRSIRKSPTSS
jgi:hypothetical protein